MKKLISAATLGFGLMVAQTGPVLAADVVIGVPNWP